MNELRLIIPYLLNRMYPKQICNSFMTTMSCGSRLAKRSVTGLAEVLIFIIAS